MRPGFPVNVNYDWTTPLRCQPSTIPNCDAHVDAAHLKRDEFNRKDWGVNWNAALEAGGVLVSEKVTLEFEVSAIRTSTP